MNHDKKYIWLDLIRGLAALLVCFGHLRAATMIDYPLINSPSIFDKVFYLIAGLGHQAVMVFFVLSGFFVGGSILKNKDKFRWDTYLATRLSRLWIVMIPALLLTYCIDEYILTNFPDILTGAFSSIWHSVPSEGMYSNSLLTLLGNIFFLHGIFTPVFGSNGPIWSLANEFWYYILFPLILTASSFKKVYSYINTIRLLLIAVIIFLMPIPMLEGFLIWCFGAFVYFLNLKKLYFAGVLMVVSGLLFAMSLIYGKLNVGFIPDLLVGITFSFFTLILISKNSNTSINSLLANLASNLSNISYSLYLSHFPLVLLIGATFYKEQRLVPSLKNYATLLGWLFILVLFGFGFWCLFERHTPRLKSFFINLTAKFN